MSGNGIEIREATREEIPLLYSLYASVGKKDDGYYEQAFEENVTILIGSDDGIDCAMCFLNFTPRYSYYKRLGIPEIQDLNVVATHRRKGIATAMIKWCEGLARARGCDLIGIAVGLFKDYGPAQILYVRLGYIPDGNGITYDREGVKPHGAYLVDDFLSLMMIKQL